MALVQAATRRFLIGGAVQEARGLSMIRGRHPICGQRSALPITHVHLLDLQVQRQVAYCSMAVMPVAHRHDSICQCQWHHSLAAAAAGCQCSLEWHVYTMSGTALYLNFKLPVKMDSDGVRPASERSRCQ